MKPDDSFINRFELFELQNYIFARKHRYALEEEFKELEQNLYDDISPVMSGYDYELGRCYKMGVDPENYTIYMIEKKDSLLKVIDKVRKQEELFDIAMDSLTPRERDVVRIVYFNKENDLGLSLDFLNEVLGEAHDKLCAFIGEERQKQRETADEERKKVHISKINEWKRGREVS